VNPSGTIDLRASGVAGSFADVRRLSRWSFSVLVALSIFGAIPFAHAEAPLTIAPRMEGIKLGPNIAVFEDESNALGIADVAKPEHAVRFVATTFDAPAYGFRKSAYWVRFTVVNPKPEAAPWFLELAYPHLDSVELFIPKPDGSFERRRTGDHVRFAQRDLQYRNFVFTLSEPPAAQNTYYMRLATTGAMNIPLVAWSPISFFDNQNREQPVLWMFYGLLLVMACYNGFIYFAVREKDYLYYSIYIVSYWMFSFTLNGHAFQYILGEHIWLANQILPFCISSTFLWSVQFLRSYLSLPTTMPKLDPWVRFAVWLSAVLCVFGLFGPYAWSIRVLALVDTTLTAVMVGSAAVLVSRGYRPAKLYLLAWGFFLFGVLLYFFKTMGILPNHFITTWSIQIGASLEVILLSLALADRINAMRGNLGDLNKKLSDNVTELREALSKAEEATRAKGAFLATVSHELRTPLNAIINIPQGLLRDFRDIDAATCASCASIFALDSDETISSDTPCPQCGEAGRLSRERMSWYSGKAEHTAQHLRIIERSGRHLLSVVNGILDFSRLDAGRLELKLEVIDVQNWLGDVLAPFPELARRKGVALILEPAPAKLSLRCDPVRLSQVLINLVGNAIKFSEGRGEVTVGARREQDGVLFWVTDEGIGIAPEDREKIFQSFEQVHKGDTRKYGGTGLGLSISRTLVNMHGGEIWVDSQVGRGSTFWFRIPMTLEAPAEAAELSIAQSLPPARARSASSPPQESPA
jgi:signal transduction histidine kinase